MDELEISKRLSSEDNVLNKYGRSVVKEFSNRPGRKALSGDSRELIGTLAHFDKQTEVGKVFGISQTSVSNIKNGTNGSGKLASFDGELAGRIKSNVRELKEKVSDLALGRLTKAIECMTDDKLNGAKLSELAIVTSSLGKVARLDEELGSVAQNNFVFYAPRNKNEDAYEVVEVA